VSVRFLNDNSSNNTDVVAKTFPSSSYSVRSASPWVRNPSWPACEANSGDNRVRGLYAVWPGGGNFIAMTVAGAYTVDYGDGTTTNYATGIQANYEYDYADADLVGTEAPVTFTDSTDTVNRTAHGYTNGMQVRFFNITTTTGIVNSQFYFVINATANTFQVSATAGGSAIALTNDGTGQLLPYRIATVTITPQAANNLTSINLFVKNATTGLTNGFVTGWLDLAFAASTITTLTIGSSSTTVRQNYIERVRLNQLGAITTFANLFQGLVGLRNVVIASTITTVTNTSSMFISCSGIQTVPLFNTASVTNMTSMFSSCTSLQTVPLFNTASVSNMTSMFNGCYSLQTVPLFNTASVTNTTSMFTSCTSLQTVPAFNLITATSLNTMFNGCTSLQTVPLFNIRTASAVNMTGMFSGCTGLQTVPLLNTAAVTNMTNMFSGCTSLQTVPLFNTASVTAMGDSFGAGMFKNCTSLQTVTLTNAGAVTTMQEMFSGCTSLQTVSLFTTTSLINVRQMFFLCSNLQTVSLFNTSAVTNMQGMFQGCSILQTVPLFNTAAVTNMTSMFINNFNLQTVPLFDTAAVIDTGNMFDTCHSLTSVPALITTASTNFSFMFRNCFSLARMEAKNFNLSFSMSSCKLSATALNEIYTNLPTVATTQTLTITSNYGVDAAVTKSVTTTAQSVTVPMAVTSDLVVGEFVTGAGTGITTGISVVSDVTANTFTLTNHGLTDGKRVSFATLSTTTGISAWTIYFVVGATADTFQVALTVGGSAIDLTGTNATLNARYPSVITAIDPGVSVTLDTPAATSGVTTLSFRTLNSSTALLKNWTISF
jgi:surface protein